MARSRGDDLAARNILILAILLAATLIGVSLGRTDEDDLVHGEGTLELDLDGHVRVLLTRAGRGPYTLELEDGAVLEGHGRSYRGQLGISLAAGQIEVEGRREPGALATPPESNFRLNGAAYRGRLVFDPRKSGGRPILSLPLEEYLAQVLPGEMPMSYPDEALLAQVIAARSFACFRMQLRRSRDFDVSDSETSQMFEPLSRQTARARKLVERTEDLILSFEGRVLPAYYSANCGGDTRSNAEAFGEAELAPLAGVTCGYCQWSRHYQWRAELEAAEVVHWYDLKDSLQQAHVLESEGSDYEVRMRLRSSAQNRVIRTRDLKRRSRGGLKSSRITGADVAGSKLVLSGRGFGHGVGLCQNGARGLAQAGKKAPAILEHYYPGARLQELRSTRTP